MKTENITRRHIRNELITVYNLRTVNLNVHPAKQENGLVNGDTLCFHEPNVNHHN